MSISQVAEVLVVIKAGAMTVAKIEANRVVADAFPAHDLHTVEFLRARAAILVAEDILFALGLGAGGGGAQLVERKIGLGAIAPNDGYFAADDLYVSGRFHERDGQLDVDLRFLRTK